MSAPVAPAAAAGCGAFPAALVANLAGQSWRRLECYTWDEAERAGRPAGIMISWLLSNLLE